MRYERHSFSNNELRDTIGKTKFKDLAINNNDIMNICELKPCEAVGIIKQEIMEWVLQYPEINTKERLNMLVGCYYCNDDLEDIKDIIETKILTGEWDK